VCIANTTLRLSAGVVLIAPVGASHASGMTTWLPHQKSQHHFIKHLWILVRDEVIARDDLEFRMSIAITRKCCAKGPI
jgi:hypothetical protein